MHRVLVLIFALATPALADGCGVIFSFMLCGGPVIPLIAVFGAGWLSRKWLRSGPPTTISFLLSIPAAILGLRASFEFLMHSEGFIANLGIFFGPAVLLGSTLPACLPGLLLGLSPYTVQQGDASDPEPARFQLARLLPILFVAGCSAILTYYSLGFGS